MNLTGGVLHDAGIERQKVADIAGGLIGDVHNLLRIHGAFVGDLFDIDTGNRVSYIDLLPDDLLVVEDDADAVEARVKIACNGLVETGLIHAKLIKRGLLKEVGAMAGIVGPLVDRGKRRLKNRNFCAGNSLAVFVNYRIDDWRACVERLGTHKPGGEKENQDRDEALYTGSAWKGEKSYFPSNLPTGHAHTLLMKGESNSIPW
jgi:hypothetical protein